MDKASLTAVLRVEPRLKARPQSALVSSDLRPVHTLIRAMSCRPVSHNPMTPTSVPLLVKTSIPVNQHLQITKAVLRLVTERPPFGRRSSTPVTQFSIPVTHHHVVRTATPQLYHDLRAYPCNPERANCLQTCDDDAFWNRRHFFNRMHATPSQEIAVIRINVWNASMVETVAVVPVSNSAVANWPVAAVKQTCSLASMSVRKALRDKRV